MSPRQRLRQLYQRRLAVTRELHELNAMIQKLEKTDVWDGAKRVHHKTGGCRGTKNRLYRKETTDWTLVDCIVCHKMRDRPPARRTVPETGESWDAKVRGAL